jgi:hypothetical protein
VFSSGCTWHRAVGSRTLVNTLAITREFLFPILLGVLTHFTARRTGNDQ